DLSVALRLRELDALATRRRGHAEIVVGCDDRPRRGAGEPRAGLRVLRREHGELFVPAAAARPLLRDRRSDLAGSVAPRDRRDVETDRRCAAATTAEPSTAHRVVPALRDGRRADGLAAA